MVSPSDSWLREGVMLLGRYELEVPIAEGGMGIVWRALDHVLGAAVAVKFSKSLDESARWRFAEEARLAGRLASPYLVRVFDIGTHGNVPFLVMELLEGQTLRELLMVRGKLAPWFVLTVVRQVAEALSIAHAAGVVHRDIKPANIFIIGREEAPVVKLLDFGVAKFGLGEWTSTGGWLGTPHYVSPEQALDASEVDASSDLWALAVIVYECLTGCRPFEGSSAIRVSQAILDPHPHIPSEIEGSLPAEFDDWILKALDRDRKKRPRTALLLVEGLERAFAFSQRTSVVRARDDEEMTRENRPDRTRSRWPLALAILSGLAAGAAGFVLGAKTRSPSGPGPAPSALAEGSAVCSSNAPTPCFMTVQAHEVRDEQHLIEERPEQVAPESGTSPVKPGGRNRDAGIRGPVVRSTEQIDLAAEQEDALWRKRL